MREKDKHLGRDIEFRAVETGTGKFIYGFPRKTRLGNWIVYSNRDDDAAAVKPDSISQYTGIDDKDGNRVYENDTILITSPLVGKPYERKVDWLGFVDFHTTDFDRVHLDDLEACGYGWSLKPLKQ